jgi:hypothetical protein
MLGWTKNALDILFCCVKIASAQLQLTAGYHIVLYQRHTVLSGCNVRSYIDFLKHGNLFHVRKLKLVVDETLVFPVALKQDESHVPCIWNCHV